MPRRTNKQIRIQNTRFYKSTAKPFDKQANWIRNFTEVNEGFTGLYQPEKRWELPRHVQLTYSRQSEAHKEAERRRKRTQKKRGR